MMTNPEPRTKWLTVLAQVLARCRRAVPEIGAPKGWTVLAAWSVLLFLAGASPALGAGLRQLPGHVPAATKQLQPIGRLAATNELHLAIGVALRDPAALGKFIQELYDPASRNFRQYLTPAGFAARFGASEEDYAAVRSFASANGLKVTGEYASRVLLDVSGPAAAVEKAFHIKLQKFRHPTEARDFYAPDTEPSVEAALPILHVSGLHNYWLPHSRLRKTSPDKLANEKPRSGSGSKGTYLAKDLRAAYVPGTSLTGAGQNVGLVQFDGYYANDITRYISLCGITTSTILTNVPIDGGPGSPPGSGNEEVALDIEMVLAMAPGVSKIYVYEGVNNLTQWATILGRMADDNVAKQLSTSWGGGGTDPNSEVIFQQMLTQGQTFFNASGDQDSFNGNSNFPGFPTDSTNVIQVGGTTLTTSGPLGSYVSETVWNERTANTSAGSGDWGSSGGIGPNYSIPSYQSGVSMAANGGSTAMRNVPDVALTANNIWSISDDGSGGSTGGTSCAAPLWAGFTALINQQLAQNTGNATNSVGFLNPAIYAIGLGLNSRSSYASTFHDITSGDNTWPTLSSQFYAVAGYDLCTGWGTPKGTNLINALAGVPDPLGITPAVGFTASGLAGGPFSGTPQTLTLTNSGASSLSWSLVNPSAWLMISVSSGTLAAGTQTNLTANLTAAANRLAAGNYAAAVVFSNQTSHVAQPRQFSLQVLSSLALSPASGFTASGLVGGEFSVTSLSYALTNFGAAALQWGIVNTSLWLTASPAGGSLAGGAHTNSAISLSAAAYSLPAGVYAASVLVTNQGIASASLSFRLQAGQSAVQNGGFETGDFTGWSLVGDGIAGGFIYNAVEASSFTAAGNNYVHSGNYAAVLGESGYAATLSQPVSTIPGQNYLLSCWLINPSSQATEIFALHWSTNGTAMQSLYGITNPPVFDWTNLSFVVTATGTNSTIQIAAENDNDYFGLDDVSLTPIPKPTFNAVVKGSNVMVSTWYTVPGVAYAIQYKTNLLQPNWINLSTNTANASTASFTNLIGRASSWFYRILQLP